MLGGPSQYSDRFKKGVLGCCDTVFNGIASHKDLGPVGPWPSETPCQKTSKMNFTNNRLTSLRIAKLRAYLEKLIGRWSGCSGWSGLYDG